MVFVLSRLTVPSDSLPRLDNFGAYTRTVGDTGATNCEA